MSTTIETEASLFKPLAPGSLILPAQTGYPELPRPDYPRPSFRRGADSWLNLNGIWEFTFDDANNGLAANWEVNGVFDQYILVPFAFQSKLSGIGDPDFHDYLWYARNFELPADWQAGDGRYRLHFGAVDYKCKVWLNGAAVGEHTGGHVGFSFDVTEFIQPGVNRLVVYVEDTQSKYQARGKQFWKRDSEFCFYTRTSGIWQTVWLEKMDVSYLTDLRLTPDFDRAELHFALTIGGERLAGCDYGLGVEISFEGRSLWHGDFAAQDGRFSATLSLPELHAWTPETPHLYDLRLTLRRDGNALDEVETYFGMRKISVENGRVLLNNQPYYLRLVLDQGYFPEGLLTAPSDTALRQDIEWAKAFGFNGARKHQKIEDPRWLYWADRLGLLVWGEMPSAYEWSADGEAPFVAEWQEVLARDYNHPCIMTWVVFNESWGIEQIRGSHSQQDFVRRASRMTRETDATRLVIDNDGWEHQDGESDLLTIHDYTASGAEMQRRYANFAASMHAEDLPTVSERPVLLPGATYRNEPVIFSEVGGASLIAAQNLADASSHGVWGYHNAADAHEFIEQYGELISGLKSFRWSSGFCYTQLTDVEQEVNGLLTYDRRPKVDPAVIARFNLAD
jgi:beta-galactosidase/beta-glucuronidase